MGIYPTVGRKLLHVISRRNQNKIMFKKSRPTFFSFVRYQCHVLVICTSDLYTSFTTVFSAQVYCLHMNLLTTILDDE